LNKKLEDTSSRKRRRQILNGWWAYCSNDDFLPDSIESVVLLVRSHRFSSAFTMAKRITYSEQIYRNNPSRPPKHLNMARQPRPKFKYMRSLAGSPTAIITLILLAVSAAF
jgi:hypothetical protein